MYTSAVCIFSAGTSQQWVKNICCQDLMKNCENEPNDIWPIINERIEKTPAGSNGVMFNPSLAGGSMLEPSPFMSGAFTGLKLSTTREDLLRASQEGIALNLRVGLDVFKKYHSNINEMLIVGGGAKSNI